MGNQLNQKMSHPPQAQAQSAAAPAAPDPTGDRLDVLGQPAEPTTPDPSDPSTVRMPPQPPVVVAEEEAKQELMAFNWLRNEELGLVWKEVSQTTKLIDPLVGVVMSHLVGHVYLGSMVDVKDEINKWVFGRIITIDGEGTAFPTAKEKLVRQDHTNCGICGAYLSMPSKIHYSRLPSHCKSCSSPIDYKKLGIGGGKASAQEAPEGGQGGAEQAAQAVGLGLEAAFEAVSLERGLEEDQERADEEVHHDVSAVADAGLETAADPPSAGTEGADTDPQLGIATIGHRYSSEDLLGCFGDLVAPPPRGTRCLITFFGWPDKFNEWVISLRVAFVRCMVWWVVHCIVKAL